MKTNPTKKMFSWDELKEGTNVQYQNEDFFVIEDPHSLPTIFQLDFCCFVKCEQGCIQMEFEGKSYTLQANQLMILPINTPIYKVSLSEDVKGAAVCISSRLLRNTFEYSATMRNIGLYMNQNPIITLDERNRPFEEALRQLGKLIKLYKNAPFFHEMVRSLFQFILYTITSFVSQFVEEPENDMLSRGDILFGRFMEILAKNHTKQRQVSFYAQELCVTPKYLSTVCKSVSGRSASAWINEYVVKEIRDLLVYSDLSVKEICAHMDFPNISFFGRYVKKHLGESPLTYRKNLKKK